MVHYWLLVSRILIYNKLSIVQKVCVGMVSVVCIIFYHLIFHIFFRQELEWGINVELNSTSIALV